jgi:3-carboxy-cis,cis-muconate cycloisomerase
LAQSLSRDPAVTAHIAPHEIEKAADPARYIGLSGREVDRVLAACADRPAGTVPEPTPLMRSETS